MRDGTELQDILESESSRAGDRWSSGGPPEERAPKCENRCVCGKHTLSAREWLGLVAAACAETLCLLGSAQEFGETANWRRLERFALPGMAGIRIPALNGRSEAATY